MDEVSGICVGSLQNCKAYLLWEASSISAEVSGASGSGEDFGDKAILWASASKVKRVKDLGLKAKCKRCAE